jgi:hypothetical protein
MVDFLLFNFCLISDLCVLFFHRNGISSGSLGNVIKVGPVPTIQIQLRQVSLYETTCLAVYTRLLYDSLHIYKRKILPNFCGTFTEGAIFNFGMIENDVVIAFGHNKFMLVYLSFYCIVVL